MVEIFLPLSPAEARVVMQALAESRDAHVILASTLDNPDESRNEREIATVLSLVIDRLSLL